MEDDFEKIYAELHEKNNKALNDAKSARNKKILKVLLICILIDLIIILFSKETILAFITLPISIIISLLIFHNENVKYKKLFKSVIIKEIVKKCNDKLIYNPDGIITRYDYKMSRFDTSFNEFFSEDKIYGTLGENTNFQMGQVTTKEVKRTIRSDGSIEENRVETFRGIYGIIKLEKTSNSNIYIANNSITKKFDSKRVEMDSSEFEKEYDCLTKDKLTAMKIFTSDVIEILINLKKAKLTAFELKIEDDMIYFRSRCGEIFEPPGFKNALQKELIRKYYDIIYLPIHLIEKIIENVETI